MFKKNNKLLHWRTAFYSTWIFLVFYDIFMKNTRYVILQKTLTLPEGSDAENQTCLSTRSNELGVLFYFNVGKNNLSYFGMVFGLQKDWCPLVLCKELPFPCLIILGGAYLHTWPYPKNVKLYLKWVTNLCMNHVIKGPALWYNMLLHGLLAQ